MCTSDSIDPNTKKSDDLMLNENESSFTGNVMKIEETLMQLKLNPAQKAKL